MNGLPAQNPDSTQQVGSFLRMQAGWINVSGEDIQVGIVNRFQAVNQRATGNSHLPTAGWDAFVLATNAVVVFIVLGGLFSLAMGSLPQRKPAKGEGKA